MNAGTLRYTTPNQLQDYLTCPMLFKFKHILKIPEALTGDGWMRIKIHEILHKFQMNQRDHPDVKSSIFLDTQYCLEHFSRCFFNFSMNDGDKLPIDWKKETPESTNLKGKQLLTAILRHQDFRKVQLHDTEKSFLFHLMPDHDQGTFIPWDVATEATLSIDCRFDAITKDHTILEYHTCHNSCNKREVECKLKFDLLGLALHLKNSNSSQQSTHFNCFNLIKRNNSTFIQRIDFEKNHDDRLNSLIYLYEINGLMATQLYPPKLNSSCLNHCSYNNQCRLLKQKERNK